METSDITETTTEDKDALRELIRSQREHGAIVSEDINNTDEYEWENGRLTGLHWDGKLLSGDLDLSAFTALEKLECCGNRLTGLNAENCENLHTLWCFANQIINLRIRNCTNLTNLLFDAKVTIHGQIPNPDEAAEG